MKYKIISVCIASMVLILLPSQVSQKQYTVSLTLQGWEAVMDVIEKSNAGHLEVKAVQNLILPQLRKQIADTTTKK